MTLEGLQGSTNVAVTPAVLTGVTISPADPTIVTDPTVADGTSQQFFATCSFSDNIDEDCTDEVSWTSSDNTIAQVSVDLDGRVLVTGLSTGVSSIIATINGMQVSFALTVTPAILTGITVDPVNPSIAKGSGRQLNATCVFSDNTTQNCTNEVSWTSSDNTISQVSNAPADKGLATGVGTGGGTIFAVLEGLQGTATISVTPPTLTSIVVTPANDALAVGTTLQMTATGIYSDNSMQDLTQQVEFSTSDSNVLVADNILLINGLMNALAPGSATISANYGSIVGSTSVMVNAVALTSITITPNGPIFIAKKKGSVQLTATCNFNNNTTQDCTNQVNWSTAGNNIARLDHSKRRGWLVIGNNAGQTSATADLNGVTSSVTVIVTNASVTGIQVTPTNPTVPVGTTLQMTATVFFSDNTSQGFTTFASWISSDTNVAHVLSSENQGNGQVIGLQPGTTTISVTICCYLTASSTVTVIP